MTESKSCASKQVQGGAYMEQELAYSFHLGSDKNKSKLAKKVSKENVSGTTSFSNNAIQNAKGLSKVNKHNLRDYDNQRELIITIYGTNDIVEDVKQVYLDEFEQARIEFNNKQTRKDRKIEDYFQKVCDSQNDIACEIIIELGDMDFWQDKDNEYRYKMTDVYNEQVQELSKLLSDFKIANATIHYDETSPHMHVIGVPVIENCKRGMKKQVGKSQLFTKTLLSEIQDKMRNACIKSYNKFYDVDSKLKTKQKGRNQDINVNDMSNYREMKKKLEQEKQKLDNANKQTKALDNKGKDIIGLLDSLKPMPFNKNNSQISNENIENIKDYIKDVTDVTETVRNVNDLNMAIKDFEHSAFEIASENRSLRNEIEQKNKDIKDLKAELSAKNKIIEKLNGALDKAKTELSKFKSFWKSLMKKFQIKIFDERYYNVPEENRNYTIVADDLINSGIFDNNDAEIVKNPTRKILTNDELTELQAKKRKNRNDINLN